MNAHTLHTMNSALVQSSREGMTQEQHYLAAIELMANRIRVNREELANDSLNILAECLHDLCALETASRLDLVG